MSKFIETLKSAFLLVILAGVTKFAVYKVRITGRGKRQ